MPEVTHAPAREAAGPDPAARRHSAEPGATPELGNQLVQGLFDRGLRAKLEVGGADDPEERQADALAARALNGPAGAPCACGGGCPSCGGGGKGKIRRSAEAGAPVSAGAATGFGNRAGRPLGLAARRDFEPRFGADFSAVRIHDDPATHRLARGIGARAFAIGGDIGFAEGRHRPETAAGRALLAHELAHVALGHGKIRRNGDGEDRITAPAKPVEPPKETTPMKPSAGFFYFQSVPVADDPEFMRGELRRVIAHAGIDGADTWLGLLVAGQGRPMPGVTLPFSAHSRAYGGQRVRSAMDAQRDMQEEQARAALAAAAIPTTVSVYQEVRAEAVAFLDTFEQQAIAVTLSILKSSEERAEAERLRYGLERKETTVTRTRRDEFGVRDSVQETRVSHSMDDQMPGRSLAGAAKDLLAKREEVAQLAAQQMGLFESKRSGNEIVDVLPAENRAEHARLGALIKEKQGELTLLEGVYQDKYPVLSRISGDQSALTQIATGPSAGTAEVLNEQIYGTLDNIKQVRGELKPGGQVKIWKLPEIVALAKAGSGANDATSLGRMKSRVVDDKVKQVADEEFWRNMVMTALAIGLAVLAAVPTGGSSLVAGAAAVAGVGSFALSAFQAAEHLDQYMIEKAMAGTDLDRARAIGASDPSLFWLAVDIAGAFADLGGAVKGARTLISAGRGAFQSIAGAARKFLAASGPEAALELANLRKAAAAAEAAHGVPGLASRVVGSAERLAGAGASVEKTLAKSAGNEAKAIAKGVAELEEGVGKALAASPTRLGGHKVSVMPNGWLVRCTVCGTLRAEFGPELARNHELATRVFAAEDKAARAAASGNKALAQEAADEARVIADQLEGMRRTRDIRLYRGVRKGAVDDIYLMDPRLVIDMPFVGAASKTKNSAGWLRDNMYYWEELAKRHPEAFSQANLDRIAGRPPLTQPVSPINDPTFRAVFPQYDIKGMRGEPLIHHHIGGGGQAAAVPSTIHPGSGGIHNVEKEAGIWGGEDEVAEMLQRMLDNTPATP